MLHQRGIHKFSSAPFFHHRSNNAQLESLLRRHTEMEAGQLQAFYADNQ